MIVASQLHERVAHLQGREKALEPLGWTERKAAWIALACLHADGVFTREQLSYSLQMSRWQALRFVQDLVTKGIASEALFEDLKVCRVFNGQIFRALGGEDIRRRPVASRDSLLRRLLALDYVIEHPGLPWLPTEAEKVRAFEALGIERRHLPLRVYRGAEGGIRHYFQLKLPLAFQRERAIFVFVDPGYDTDTALRSWGGAHRGLWKALRERGRKIEVVAVAREFEVLRRAEKVLGRWVKNFHLPASAHDSVVGEEIAKIEQVILKGSVQVLEEYGGLQAALKRSVALKKLARQHSHKPILEGFSTWRSERLSRWGF